MTVTFKYVHRMTVAVTINQGIHPCQAGTGRDEAAGASDGGCAMVNSGSGAGRQTCRNSNVMASEPSAANTSVKV